MAGRHCKICWRPDRAAIEAYAWERTPGEVARRFPPLKRDAVRRHMEDHAKGSGIGTRSPVAAGRLTARAPEALPSGPPTASARPAEHAPVEAFRLRLERDHHFGGLAYADAEDLAWEISTSRRVLEALGDFQAGRDPKRAAAPCGDDPAEDLVFLLCDVLAVDERYLLVPGHLDDEKSVGELPWTCDLLRATFAPLADSRYGPAGLEALVSDAVEEAELRHAYAEARLRYLERPVSTWKAPAGLLAEVTA